MVYSFISMVYACDECKFRRTIFITQSAGLIAQNLQPDQANFDCAIISW